MLIRKKEKEMNTRYLEDDGSLKNVYEKVIQENFPFMANAATKLIFDTKKRQKNKRTVLASCKLARDMEKFLTKDEVEYGYDYFIFVDKTVWGCASEEDRYRLMRHECRHMTTNDQGDFALAPHDVEDFAVEMELNQDNPMWAINLALIADSVYEQEKAAQKKEGK
jgi:hypothetical protein